MHDEAMRKLRLGGVGVLGSGRRWEPTPSSSAASSLPRLDWTDWTHVTAGSDGVDLARIGLPSSVLSLILMSEFTCIGISIRRISHPFKSLT